MTKRFYMDNLFIQTTIRSGEKVITPISETAHEEIRGRQLLHGSESGPRTRVRQLTAHARPPAAPSQVGRSGLRPRPAPPRPGRGAHRALRTTADSQPRGAKAWKGRYPRELSRLRLRGARTAFPTGQDRHCDAGILFFFFFTRNPAIPGAHKSPPSGCRPPPETGGRRRFPRRWPPLLSPGTRRDTPSQSAKPPTLSLYGEPPRLNNGPRSRLTTSDRHGGARPLARSGPDSLSIGRHRCRSQSPSFCVPIGSAGLRGGVFLGVPTPAHLEGAAET